MEPNELDVLLDRTLRTLPAPHAPSTLLPHVMAAARQAARRPWYAREWQRWPAVWQRVSLVALLAVGVPTLASTDAIAASTAQALISLAAATPDLAAAITVTRAMWQALVQPLALCLFVIVGLMVIACVGCGAALERVTWREATR